MLNTQPEVPERCVKVVRAELIGISEEDQQADLEEYLKLLEECKKFDEPFDYDGYCYLFHDIEPGETITMDVDMNAK